MFNIGGGEVLVILVLALVVLGPDKLPSAARTFGKHLGDFRRISGGFRAEIANAMNIDSSAPAPTTGPAPVAAPTSEPTTTPAPVESAAERVAVRSDGPVESFA